MAQQRLSLIIATYNRHDSLERLFSSIFSSDSAPFETIVVDQSPNSQIKSQKFKEKFPSVIYVCVKRPNLPAARNRGIRVSKGDILVFIDDDATVDKTCLANHSIMHKNQNIHAVAGRIRQMNEPDWAKITSVTSINTETGEAIGNFDLDFTGKVLYASGGHMSIKRSVFERFGLFNEYFSGNALFEDVEFFHRIRKGGCTIQYNSEALIYHYPQDTGGCHRTTGNPYLLERLHNYLLNYLLHHNLIPSKESIRYTRNLIEFITRTKNNRHSVLKLAHCVTTLLRAYGHALFSPLTIQKLKPQSLQDGTQ